MEQPVLVVPPGIRVIVNNDSKPGTIYLVDAATYWKNDGSGWERPLFKEADQ
jgi:hypothetical protein